MRVQGGAAAAEVRADETGHFSLDVQLVPDSINGLRLNAVDSSGNVSDALLVQVIADCTPPSVVSADRQGSQFRIVFSEAVTSASVASAVQLSSSQGAVAGSVSLGTDGRTATFTPSGSLPSGALRLDVSAAVRDLAGNVMAFPWSQVFGAAGGDGFVSGTVIDDATGRPLAGAKVEVVATNGTALADPRPEQVTGTDGRFRIAVPAGTHDLTISRAGYTPGFRVTTTTAGQGIDIFDPRLTPAALPQTIGAAGGTAGTAPAPLLTLPAGALGASTPVAVTALSEQGLPSPLPYGWSPRGAVWLDLAGAALLAQSTLSLPVESPDGTSLAVVHLDLATLQWRVVDSFTVAAGRVSIALPAAAAALTDGGYAALEADSGATAPPAAVAGAVLAGSPRPSGDDVTSATLTFDPQVVLPGQTSLATAAFTTTGDVASGLPLTLVVEESLTLLDESSRLQAPYQADLILYHAPGGAPRSRFQLRPSDLAQMLPLKVGAEDVTLRTYGDAVAGNVVGADGGSIADAEGDRIDLPAGAVADPTAVTLTREAAQDLPLALPAGTEFAGVVELDLGGRGLLLPGALALALSPAPASGDKGLLLQVVDLEAGPAWRPVAALTATATGWSTAAIDPADLPWPGARDQGLYAFVRLTSALGYLRGTVHDVGGGALAEGQVRGTSVSWLQITTPDGRYVLPVPVSTVNVTAEDPSTGNLGAASATIPAADARVDLDIALAATGPHVVEIAPANGAADVLQGIQPTVRFSKAIDAASVTGAVQLLQGGGPVAIDLDVQGGALLRVTPRATLLPNTAYELRVSTAVRDLVGNPLDAPAIGHLHHPAPPAIDRPRPHPGLPGGARRQRQRAGDRPRRRRAGRLPRLRGEPFGAGQHPLRDRRRRRHLQPLAPGDAHPPAGPARADRGEQRGGHRAHPLPHRRPQGRLGGRGGGHLHHRRRRDGARARGRLRRSHPGPARAAAAHAARLAGAHGDGRGLQLPARLRRRPSAEAAPDQHPEARRRARRGRGGLPAQPHDRDRGQDLLDAARPDAARRHDRPAHHRAPAGGLRRLRSSRDGGRRLAGRSVPARGGAGTGRPGDGAEGARADLQELRYRLRLPGPVRGRGGADSPRLHDLPLVRHELPGGDLEPRPGGDGDVARQLGLPASRRGRRPHSHPPEPAFHPGGARPLQWFPALPEDLPGGDERQPRRAAPDVYGDKVPPTPVDGNPVRFIPLNLVGSDEQQVAAGIKAKLDNGQIDITGEADATQKTVEIRLFGLDDTADATTTSAEDGSFGLNVSGKAGNRYLLAIGARIPPDEPLEITFSEALFEGFPGIDVVDSTGHSLQPQKDPVGTRATARIHLATGWRAGQKYSLRLGPELADASGNAWQHELSVEFEVAASENLGTFELPAVRDVAHLGSWLFVAADTKGMMVLNADDPAHLTNVLPGDLAMPFPYSDPVRGVAIDPHGRVLVAGGGVNSPGQLKIFDPLALNVEAITASPDDLSLRLAAYKGSRSSRTSSAAPGPSCRRASRGASRCCPTTTPLNGSSATTRRPASR